MHKIATVHTGMYSTDLISIHWLIFPCRWFEAIALYSLRLWKELCNALSSSPRTVTGKWRSHKWRTHSVCVATCMCLHSAVHTCDSPRSNVMLLSVSSSIHYCTELSIKDGTRASLIDVLGFTRACITPPLAEAKHYSMSNSVMCSNYAIK